jgi:hypothetical protein
MKWEIEIYFDEFPSKQNGINICFAGTLKLFKLYEKKSCFGLIPTLMFWT